MKENKTFRNTFKVLRVIFYVSFAYVLYLRFKKGEYISLPLVIWILIIPEGIYNILTIRKQYQGSEESKKKFNKIFLRSVILAIMIVSIIIIAALLSTTR